jgi:hypothetical protein
LRWSLQGRPLRRQVGLVGAVAELGPFHPGTILELAERNALFSVDMVLAVSASPHQHGPRFDTFANYSRVSRVPSLEVVPMAVESVLRDAPPRRLVCCCHFRVPNGALFSGASVRTNDGWQAEELLLPEAAPVLAAMITRALSAQTDTRIAWLEALRTG